MTILTLRDVGLVGKLGGVSIITDGLVLYLDAGNLLSYPGTGTTWTDLSGNGNNGTLVNGVGYSAVNGGTLVFNGTNNFASIGSVGLPFASSPGTLCAWAKTNAISNNYTWIVSYGSANPSAARFLGIQSNSYLFGGYGNDVTALGVPLNTWFNMVGVYDGSVASLYLNGNLIASGSKTWNTVSGSAQVGRQVNASEYWNGNISQVLTYNKALTGAEIAQNYNVFRGRYGV